MPRTMIDEDIARQNFRLTPRTVGAVVMTPNDFIVEYTTNIGAASAVTLPFSKELPIGAIRSVRLVTHDGTNDVTVNDLTNETKSIAAAVVLNTSGEVADFITTPFGWVLLRNA